MSNRNSIRERGGEGKREGEGGGRGGRERERESSRPLLLCRA